MRRSYYRKPGVSYQVGRLEAEENILELRQRILGILLKGLSIVGAPVLVYHLFQLLPDKAWGAMLFYVSVYLWVLWITLDKSLPYRLRAVGFVVIPFMLGIAAIIMNGVGGDGRIWLLGFTALGTLLVGLNFGIGAIITSLVILFGSGFLLEEGLISPPNAAWLATSATWTDWALAGVVWTLIATAITVSTNVLIQGLIITLEKERKMSLVLNSDREQTSRRARELDRRLLQIRTAAEVSRSLSAVLDPKRLLQQVVELMKDRFDLYYVGVFLVDESGDVAVLGAGTGEAGKEMIESGHKLAVGSASMVGWTIANRKARIALDIGRDPMRFSNPLLPLTRSEMALPLISGEQVFGALTVQSTLPEAFDQDDIIVMQGIADSLATSLQNARLFEESQKNLQEIYALNRQYMVQAWRSLGKRSDVRRTVYENEGYLGGGGIITTKHFPILLRDQVIGQLSFDTDKQELTPEEQTFVQEVTTQAALAMENIRLLEETQRRASMERLLSDVVQDVRSQTDLDMILRSTVSELGKALGATDGMIYLLPEFLVTSHATASVSQGNGNGHQSESS